MPAASFKHAASSTGDDYEHRVLEIWKRLRDAHGADTAYSLSHAALYLAHIRRDERLFEEDRARLVDMLETAQANALTDLPTGINREDILRGFAALGDSIQMWSETPIDRKTWGDAAVDVFAKVRIFRNRLHNADLEAQIAERAAKRRRAVVEGLRLVGLEFAPWADVPTPAPRKGMGRR